MKRLIVCVVVILMLAVAVNAQRIPKGFKKHIRVQQDRYALSSLKNGTATQADRDYAIARILEAVTTPNADQ